MSVQANHQGWRRLHNPGTGETYQFEVVEGPDGLLRMRWWLAPGGSVPEHIHPCGDERFEILAGAVRFFIDGQPHVARAGEQVVIPRGTPHHFQHLEGPVEAYVEVEPAGSMKEFFEAVSGLAREGRSSTRGVPKHPLQLIAFAAGFWDSFQATRPPRAVQRLLLTAAPLAHRAGFARSYARYDALTGTV